jgi:predicted Zn-dependent protease
MNVRSIGAALAGLAVLAVSARAEEKKTPPARALEFSTKSADARAGALDAVRRIESFQGGAKALEAAQKAVAADPEFAFGHFLAALNSPQAAAKAYFDKAAELAPKASDGERRYMEAHALNRAQKRADALEAFRKLAADYPGDRMVQVIIGQIATADGRFDEARAALEKALAMDASTPRVHALLGNVVTLQDEYTRARAHYQQAAERQAAGTAPGQVYVGHAARLPGAVPQGGRPPRAARGVHLERDGAHQPGERPPARRHGRV